MSYNETQDKTPDIENLLSILQRYLHSFDLTSFLVGSLIGSIEGVGSTMAVNYFRQHGLPSPIQKIIDTFNSRQNKPIDIQYEDVVVDPIVDDPKPWQRDFDLVNAGKLSPDIFPEISPFGVKWFDIKNYIMPAAQDIDAAPNLQPVVLVFEDSLYSMPVSRFIAYSPDFQDGE